jgi:hypothetical protein
MSQLVLTAESLSSPAVAGTTEYNGTIQTFTPLGTQRGVTPSEQFFSLNAGRVGSDIATAQSSYGVGVTVSASTQYEFELLVNLSKAAGATSHTIATGFGGTATVNVILYAINGISTAGAISNQVQTAASTVITGAIAAASSTFTVIIKGVVSINAGGTFIPQYTLSAAPGGAYTTIAGSYMKIKPIGVSGANVSVGTWA